jgi:hypothetical protein
VSALWCGAARSVRLRFARCRFDPARSDADFLVEFDKESGLPALDQFLGFSEALERILGRPVDLVEASAVRNPYVRATINRSKELIYTA